MTGPNRPGRWRIDMTEQEQLRQLKEEYENMQNLIQKVHNK